MLREEMAEAGLDPGSVEVREIDTEASAEREGFVGSPTIRIDGADLQPPAENEPPGLTCRIYRRRDDSASPLPDPADLRDALTAAATVR
jgi:hypothetical protein